MEKIVTSPPTEVLETIFNRLDKADLISAAGISRYWRDSLLPKLFRSLRLRLEFVYGRSVIEIPLEQGEDHFYGNRSRDRHRRAKEVLERMAKPLDKEPDIAPLVEELQIVIIEDFDVEYTQFLLRALERLPGLRHFSWTGRTIPAEIITFLAAPSRQFSVSLNMEFPGPRYMELGDSGFGTAITTLSQILEIDLVDDHEEYDHNRCNLFADEVQSIIGQHWGFLRTLALDGSSAFKLDGQIRTGSTLGTATNLTRAVFSFALQDMDDMSSDASDEAPHEEASWSGIQALLRQTPALESLTLVNATSLRILPSEDAALPALKELKIGIERFFEPSYETPDMNESARIIHDFVLAHRNLTRFDFTMWTTWQEQCGRNDFQKNAAWFSLILDAVCSLEHLTALGLTFPGLLERDMQAAVDRIIGREQLKRSCRALRLGGLTDVPMQISLTGFSRCSFFAASSGRPLENTKSRYEPPSVERLVSIQTDARLEQVCLNGRLYDILRADSDETKVVTKRWDNRRVQSRDDSDFHNSDGHWLMKYRGISEYNETARVFGVDGGALEEDDFSEGDESGDESG